MANEFDLGLNIASIETELPDPVITLTGSDFLTASETAEMPLLALTAYGRSWHGERIVNVADIGIDRYGLPVSSDGNYTDANGQQWACDEIVVNADGTGKIIKNIVDAALNGTGVNWIKQNNYFLGYADGFVPLVTSSACSTVGIVSWSDLDSGGYGLSVAYGIRLRFKDMNPENNTVEDLKSYLADNNITVIARADTPTETELTAEQIAALQPVIDRYGAFTAYFMSTQDGTPTPENPVEIVSTADLHRVFIPIESIGDSGNLAVTTTNDDEASTAVITTGLPLRGIPVSDGGNYTDSMGQEWVCDTLEHFYGEPAQVTKRVETAHFKSVMETHGCDAVMVTKNTADHFVYFGKYGHYFKNSAIKYYLYECLWEERYDVKTGELIHSIERGGGNQTAQLAYEVYGKWTVKDTVEPVSFAKPLWVLDNGKPVPTEYICETDTYVNGAEVIYPCKPETLLITTKETEALNALGGFTGSTTVYNDDNAEMTVKLLREDFEMQYIHWIKESQSFVCEKAGKYKIICVGGGSSGGIGATGAPETMQAVGTTTSFGTIISAEGGGKSRSLVGTMQIGADALVGGQSGYDGINYGSTAHVMAYENAVSFSSTGGSSSVMWGTGHGYGAGGGARGYSDELVAAGGRCGKVESTIVDLEENQTVACTIGGGGVLKLLDADVLEYIKAYADPEKTSAAGEGEKVSACVSDGADGVIIIQYLGV